MTNNGEEQPSQVSSKEHVTVNGGGTKANQKSHTEVEIGPSDDKQDPALLSQENEDMSNANTQHTPNKDDSTPNVTPTKETSETTDKPVRKEVVMSSTEAQDKNKNLPRGYAYVPLDVVQKPLFDAPPILTEKRKRKPKTNEEPAPSAPPEKSKKKKGPTPSSKKAKHSKPGPKPQKDKKLLNKKKSPKQQQSEKEKNNYKKTFTKRSSRKSESKDEGDSIASQPVVIAQVASERSAHLRTYEEELRRREEEIRKREEETIKKEQELRRMEEEKRREDMLRRKEQELWQREELISRKEFELKHKEVELAKLRERDELLRQEQEQKRKLEAELRKQREEALAAAPPSLSSYTPMDAYSLDNIDYDLKKNKKSPGIRKRKSYDSYDDYSNPARKQGRIVKSEKHLSPSSIVNLSPALQECYKLLTQLMKHKYAPPFLQPVDPVLLGIPDYFTIIKNPMDLGTIHSKLEQGCYPTAEEFAVDMRLVWSNALTYNKPGTDVHFMATALSELFERKFETLLSRMNKDVHKVKSQLEAHIQQLRNSMKQVNEELEMLQSKNSPPQTPQDQTTSDRKDKKVAASVSPAPPLEKEMTFDEKVRLSQSIGNLQIEDLSGVVQIIQQSMPTLAQSTDEIEINVDTLDTVTLRKLDKYVAKCLKRHNKKAQKPQTGSGSESEGSDSDSDSDEADASQLPQQQSVPTNSTPAPDTTTTTTTTNATATIESKDAPEPVQSSTTSTAESKETDTTIANSTVSVDATETQSKSSVESSTSTHVSDTSSTASNVTTQDKVESTNTDTSTTETVAAVTDSQSIQH